MLNTLLDIKELSQVIEDVFIARKVNLAVFIDLQNAFNRVWKDALLVKLGHSHSHSGRMFKWTESYLNTE